jgi:hypothetical protein
VTRLQGARSQVTATLTHFMFVALDDGLSRPKHIALHNLAH